MKYHWYYGLCLNDWYFVCSCQGTTFSRAPSVGSPLPQLSISLQYCWLIYSGPYQWHIQLAVGKFQLKSLFCQWLKTNFCGITEVQFCNHTWTLCKYVNNSSLLHYVRVSWYKTHLVGSWETLSIFAKNRGSFIYQYWVLS